MKLFVTFRYGELIKQLTFDWFENGDNQHIAIAIDPHSRVKFEEPQYLWKGHRFFFTTPKGVAVQPRWKSGSEYSGVLYPFWWQSDEETDIACIIVPPGITSSHHYHAQTIETFGTIHNDDNTILCLNGNTPIPLDEEEVIIEKGNSHFLTRECADHFSVHLIRMEGSVRFPDRSDHHHVPKLISTYA